MPSWAAQAAAANRRLPTALVVGVLGAHAVAVLVALSRVVIGDEPWPWNSGPAFATVTAFLTGVGLASGGLQWMSHRAAEPRRAETFAVIGDTALWASAFGAPATSHMGVLPVLLIAACITALLSGLRLAVHRSPLGGRLPTMPPHAR